MRIALLEDDEHQAEVVKLWLKDAGYDCQVYGTGQDFKKGVSHDSFDAYIIDWMLPDTDGLQVLSWVREQKGSYTPVLFVTQRDSEEDVVQALEHGADDYMVKPAKQKELVARLKSVIRRSVPPEESGNQLEIGGYHVDTVARSVSFSGQSVELTNKEFDLALFLFRNIGRILSRGHILETVWGRSAKINTRTVDTHVSRLRNKLELHPENGWKLSAVYQHGYRLEHLDERVPAAH